MHSVCVVLLNHCPLPIANNIWGRSLCLPSKYVLRSHCPLHRQFCSPYFGPLGLFSKRTKSIHIFNIPHLVVNDSMVKMEMDKSLCFNKVIYSKTKPTKRQTRWCQINQSKFKNVYYWWSDKVTHEIALGIWGQIS